ncbi:MAG TPA: hypothetical protein VN192_04800 [Flavobacterium sp.]|nr:hypothetical protein [Flavobacterium sp.]
MICLVGALCDALKQVTGMVSYWTLIQIPLSTGGSGYYDILRWSYIGGSLFVINEGTVH